MEIGPEEVREKKGGSKEKKEAYIRKAHLTRLRIGPRDFLQHPSRAMV